MNIICRKTICKFNKNFVCQAKEINVTNNAACKTYEESAKTEIDTSKELYNKPPKYNKYRSCGELNIECLADCQFNCQKKCHANGITINDLTDCPYCITYFKKIKK